MTISPIRFTGAMTALAVALAPCVAAAQEPPCLSSGEFASLASYALPTAITGAATHCAPTLPPTAYLRTDGAALAARYAANKAAAWPSAKAAFLKLAGGTGGQVGDLAKNLPDDTLQQIVDTAITTKVSEALPLERCGSVSHLVQLLAPLPPETTAGIIALAIGLGASSGHNRIGKISVCSE